MRVLLEAGQHGRDAAVWLGDLRDPAARVECQPAVADSGLVEDLEGVQRRSRLAGGAAQVWFQRVAETVAVAPISTTIRGLSTEVALGTPNGLEERCVIACDHVTTIPVAALGEQIGRLLDGQETDLTAATHAAFDLD